jgi:hypothetical protein
VVLYIVETNKKTKVMKIVKNLDLDNSEHIFAYEPFLEEDVVVATIDHNSKTIWPAHGYFAPHKYGKRTEKYAKKIGYRFNNN